MNSMLLIQKYELLLLESLGGLNPFRRLNLSLLSEGRRADRDHRTIWLHWWYRKLQLCCMLL